MYLHRKKFGSIPVCPDTKKKLFGIKPARPKQLMSMSKRTKHVTRLNTVLDLNMTFSFSLDFMSIYNFLKILKLLVYMSANKVKLFCVHYFLKCVIVLQAGDYDKIFFCTLLHNYLHLSE